MNHDPATLAFYAREAAVYAARPRASQGVPLTSFLARLAPSSLILDLGCGGGQDALAMTQAGFHVTARDGCPELAAQAQSRLGVPVQVQLFEDLDDDAAFDGVWASASLLHIPKRSLGPVIHRIHRALKPSGLFYASFKTGGLAGRDALGRYYNNPSKEDLAALLSQPAWTILALTASEGCGYDGVITGWLAVTAQKSCPLAKDGRTG